MKMSELLLQSGIKRQQQIFTRSLSADVAYGVKALGEVHRD